MIPALTNEGHLPVGRFPADLETIEQRFVKDIATSATRPAIWSDFLSAVTLLRSAVPICTLWMGGSFISSKEDPDDLDVTIWVEDSDVVAARTDMQKAMLIEAFSRPGHLRKMGMRVDCFLLTWVCDPVGQGTAPGVGVYLGNRGYWDDFWLRRRSGPKGAPAVRADAYPRRGYLEVVVDGHHREGE